MPGPLRVLIVEDDAADAALVERVLTRAGFDVTAQLAASADAVSSALESCVWDIVLADYSLPGFSGIEALRIVSECDTEIPLVLVSGVIDVPTALEAMKAGAKDFVLKDDLEKLPSVVERELADAAVRRERRRAEEERDRALMDLRESNERLAEFAALTDFPVTGLTRRELVDAMLLRIAKALNADGATVLLSEGEVLRTAGAVGPNAASAAEIPIGSGFSGTIAAQDMPVYVRDVQTDARITSEAVRRSGMRSSLGVPMHLGDRVTGVLHLDWSTTFDPPSWMLPLLEIAADRCAIAIENARLYEREHGIADTLQRALLSADLAPADVEVGRFYASATEQTLVGGDFYDVFELAPGCVMFSIGDVSGKGLEAAAVTALVKNTLRAYAIDGHPPGVVMTKTGDVMTRFTEPDAFVTALHGVFDARTGSVAYSTAGHLPPIAVGPDGARLLASDGMVLGALPGVTYQGHEECLAPGESLVLYTDGLTEARSPAGEFYGEDRLREFLTTLGGFPPRDIAERIAAELDAFSGGTLRDDVAVLVLRARTAAG